MQFRFVIPEGTLVNAGNGLLMLPALKPGRQYFMDIRPPSVASSSSEEAADADCVPIMRDDLPPLDGSFELALDAIDRLSETSEECDRPPTPYTSLANREVCCVVNKL